MIYSLVTKIRSKRTIANFKTNWELDGTWNLFFLFVAMINIWATCTNENTRPNDEISIKCELQQENLLKEQEKRFLFFYKRSFNKSCVRIRRAGEHASRVIHLKDPTGMCCHARRKIGPLAPCSARGILKRRVKKKGWFFRCDKAEQDEFRASFTTVAIDSSCSKIYIVTRI